MALLSSEHVIILMTVCEHATAVAMYGCMILPCSQLAKRAEKRVEAEKGLVQAQEQGKTLH